MWSSLWELAVGGTVLVGIVAGGAGDGARGQYSVVLGLSVL